VELAILGDPVLTERQKQSLLDVYQSFRAVAENALPTEELEPATFEPAPLGDVVEPETTKQGE
jgi:hypothetical protein